MGGYHTPNGPESPDLLFLFFRAYVLFAPCSAPYSTGPTHGALFSDHTVPDSQSIRKAILFRPHMFLLLHKII